MDGFDSEPLSFEGESIEDCVAKIRNHFENLPQKEPLKRELVMPRITVFGVLLFVLPVLALVAGLTLVNIYISKPWLMILLNIGLPVAYILTTTKYNLIFSVKLYQKFAPKKIRQYCAMTPSCSEYMILAIKKFGTVKGTIKGLKRLKKCGRTEQTTDYP
ncbi:MAG: membrane protein insertion efficiency factor YidD [Firmicutes bacterium]|nr:membrane protein insertion efficiency factor YidD [Bacillota bacterium]